jgi:tetratricopeptide (TPR) repeat protein
LIVLLFLAGLAAAEGTRKFKNLKEARAAVDKLRDEALQRIEAEDLLIPDRFLEAAALRNQARAAWLEKQFDDAHAAYGKASEIYPECIEPARAKKEELAALRQKRPPELKLGFKQKKAIHYAVEWLSRHQDKVGRWDCDGFAKHDPPDDQCDGKGQQYYDVGVTALAVLVFLEAGYTDRDNHYALEVYRGLQWLISQQDHRGIFGTRESQHFHYNHAIATLALAKALALTKDERFKAPLNAAVDYIVRARDPKKGGWRYEPAGGEADTSVTTWCYRALVAANAAGIEVDLEPVTAGVRQWINSMASADGTIGYNLRGAGVARPEEKMSFLADRSRATTAAGTVTRLLLAGKKYDKKRILPSLDRCLERPPTWIPGGDIDMYYWYCGTLACAADKTRARKWKKPLHKAVLKHQHKAGSGARTGSWDPIGVWGAEGGRVYATAMMALTLIHAG